MKEKVTKKEKRLAKNMRNKEERTAIKRQKEIIKPFESLSKELDGKITEEEVEKTVKKFFTPQMEQKLLFIYKLNVDEFVDYFVEVFDRNISSSVINTIKSKLVEDYSKKYIANKVTSISDTTRDILNNRISKYLDEGYSHKDISKMIVSETKGEIGPTRAKLIAREETSQVMSTSNHKTAQEAKLKTKKWIHAGGGKTNRKSHEAINGTVIKINEKFKLGSEGKTPSTTMRFPKDAESHVAGHTINCYCKCHYK